jgi:hypothetical protein
VIGFAQHALAAFALRVTGSDRIVPVNLAARTGPRYDRAHARCVTGEAILQPFQWLTAAMTSGRRTSFWLLIVS